MVLSDLSLVGDLLLISSNKRAPVGFGQMQTEDPRWEGPFSERETTAGRGTYLAKLNHLSRCSYPQPAGLSPTLEKPAKAPRNLSKAWSQSKTSRTPRSLSVGSVGTRTMAQPSHWQRIHPYLWHESLYGIGVVCFGQGLRLRRQLVQRIPGEIWEKWENQLISSRIFTSEFHKQTHTLPTIPCLR